jgi:hypothetical protein
MEKSLAAKYARASSFVSGLSGDFRELMRAGKKTPSPTRR